MSRRSRGGTKTGASDDETRDLAARLAPNAVARGFFGSAGDQVADEDDLLASYNIDLDASRGDGNNSDQSLSPLSLPSSMLDDSDNGDIHAAALEAVRGGKGAAAGGSAGGGATSGVAGAQLNLYPSRLQNLEQEVARLAHEKELLAVDLARERKRYNEDVTALRRRNRSDFGEVRSKQAELEAEIPVLRSRLAHTKDQLRNVEISAALFEELDRMPEHELSVREFVAVQTHRLLKRERTEAERARREVETLRASLTREVEDATRKLMEASHRAKAAEDREALQRVELERVEESLAAAVRRATGAEERARELHQKGEAHDSLLARVEAAERERAAASHRAEVLETSQAALTRDRETATSRALELERRVEVLEVDKAYLQREAESAAARAGRLEQELNQVREQRRELLEASQRQLEEVAREKTAARQSYEDRLTSELRKLRDESAGEVARVRELQEQVHAREVASLREARAAAVDRARAADGELSDLRSAHELLRSELERVRTDRDAALAESRGQVRLKEFELERSGIVADEQAQALLQARHDAQRHEKRFEVLREEYSKLEQLLARERVEHEAVLAVEREKVQAYEDLELELDQAVLQGGGGEAGAAGAMGPLLPASARRRVKQSVALAQRLVRAQNECRSAKARVDEQAAELERCREQLRAANATMDNVGQPQSYFLGKTRQLGDKVAELQARADELKIELTRANRTSEHLRAENAKLREELRAVLTNRETFRVSSA